MPDLTDMRLGNDFVIRRKVGGGGMATLYEAHEIPLNRLVCIKVINDELLQGPDRQNYIERFRNEAQFAGKLNHPGIVQVHRFGEFQEFPFIVMELVDGESMDKPLAQGRSFNPLESLQTVREVVVALQFAWERMRLVHRDIKPSNIFLTDRGARLGDFGISKILPKGQDTYQGTTVGTHSYMSPEQFDGRADIRSDFYALGCVLYEMLSGKVPFTASDTESMRRAHKQRPPPKLLPAFATYRNSLIRFINRLLDPNPEGRPQKHAEFLLGLDNLIKEHRPRGKQPWTEPESQERPSPDHFPTLTGDVLEKYLQRKYDSIAFHIVETQESFDSRIGDVLLATIRKKLAQESGHTVASAVVRVGIVCGPMVLRAVKSIKARKPFKPEEDFRKVLFVAMNRAAESRSFELSASYLVTLISDAFPGSGAAAYTFNGYDKATIDSERSAVEILLCSAGAHPQVPPNYLKRWYDNAVADGSECPPIPASCIGDFCLSPIDAEGRVVRDDSFLKVVSDYLDPFPRFDRIADIRKGRECEIIFPIYIDIEGKSARSTARRQGGPLTGKELVTKTVLSSGATSQCILDATLAENVVRSVGGYLLGSISPAESAKPMRLCHAHAFQSQAKNPTDLYIFDPLGSADASCRIEATMPSAPCLREILPQIIISESRDESMAYDWGKGSGEILITLDQIQHGVQVDKGVRKPGRFSVMTAQVVMQYADQIANYGERELVIWDMGAATGFVGLVTARLMEDRIRRVDYSDVTNEALTCTQANVKSYGVEAKSRILPCQFAGEITHRFAG